MRIKRKTLIGRVSLSLIGVLGSLLISGDQHVASAGFGDLGKCFKALGDVVIAVTCPPVPPPIGSCICNDGRGNTTTTQTLGKDCSGSPGSGTGTSGYRECTWIK